MQNLFSILSHNDLKVDSKEMQLTVSFHHCSDLRYNPPSLDFDSKSTISFLSHLKKGINETLNTHNNINYVYGGISVSITYHIENIEIDIETDFNMGKNNSLINCHKIRQLSINEAKQLLSEISNAALHHKEYVIHKLNETLNPLIYSE